MRREKYPLAKDCRDIGSVDFVIEKMMTARTKLKLYRYRGIA